jgi:CBS domain-containing protein
MIVNRLLLAYPRAVLVVSPDDTIIDVSRRFEEKKAGIAMVCDHGDQLVGVVSLGDVVHAIGAEGAAVLEQPVKSIMSADLVTVEPGDPIERALNKMTERGIRHIPVVDDGRLRGLIDKPTALQVLYEEAALDFTQLRNYVFKTGGRY